MGLGGGNLQEEVLKGIPRRAGAPLIHHFGRPSASAASLFWTQPDYPLPSHNHNLDYAPPQALKVTKRLSIGRLL